MPPKDFARAISVQDQDPLRHPPSAYLYRNKYLHTGNLLAFYHNFAVAHFLLGDFASSQQYVLEILNLPDRKIRKDIRDFARLLQVVLQFERATFLFMENALRAEGKGELRSTFEEFSQKLDELVPADHSGIPLLGLTEMRIWVQSKLSGNPIRATFLGMVKRHLEAIRRG